MHETLSNSSGCWPKGAAALRGILVALLMCTALSACKKQECTRTWTSDSSKSPDGKWIAEVHEDVCDAGLGGSDDITVVLRPASVSGAATVVLAPSGQWKDPKLVKPRWLGAQNLEVSVPNRTTFGTQLPRYDGAEVAVRFENDDPTDRTRWLAWRKQNMEWVGQHSSAPQPQPPPLPK
jgi:hypothetical protein